MASVGKRGKSWFVRYRVTNDTGVETHIRKSGFLTKEDAWAAAKELERKSNAGIDVHGDMQTCGSVMERWFAEHCIYLAATTRSKYSDGIDRLRRTSVYTLPVRKLTQTGMNMLIANLQSGEGGKTVLSLHTAVTLTESLRLSMSWAAAHGYIPINPIQRARLPKTDRRPQKILNDQDIDDLVAASAGTAFCVPLLLALYGGLRREEAAALQWDAVDFKRRTVTIMRAKTRTTQGRVVTKDTKTAGSMRTVSMPRIVMDALHDAPKTSNYVCTSGCGNPYQLDSFPQATRRLIQKINAQRADDQQAPMPQASYHDLRHTHAAMLIRMGIQPKVIQERLGHASIKITMDTYGYLMTGLQEGVADALDADLQSRKSGHKASSGHGNIRVSARTDEKVLAEES